jgi:hypothetical protein
MVYRRFLPLLAITLIGLLLLSGCDAQEVQTKWSAEPVKVDGETTEWTSGSTSYFEDLGLQLGLSNDDQNLYVLFRFNNQAWAQAIRMGGVTLWLDNSAKKKKDFGIRYTGGQPLSDFHGMNPPEQGGFQEAMTPEQQERASEMEKFMADRITLIDKKNNQEVTLSPDGSGGPVVSFASPQGIYTYEFSIPLERADAFACGVGAKPGQTISIGFEWGGTDENQKKMKEGAGGGPPGGKSGGPPGGMSGGPPGGMGGGPPGGGRSPQGMQQVEKQEFWVKTQLASPAEG